MDESVVVELAGDPSPPAGDPPPCEGEGEATSLTGGLSVDQLGRLRTLLVAANPETVPELIAGDDFETLLASVGTARAAYARAKEDAHRDMAAAVPRGGGTRLPDPAAFDWLSPQAKIAAALARG